MDNTISTDNLAGYEIPVLPEGKYGKGVLNAANRLKAHRKIWDNTPPPEKKFSRQQTRAILRMTPETLDLIENYRFKLGV
jgi:hypothetical protein